MQLGSKGCQGKKRRTAAKASPGARTQGPPPQWAPDSGARKGCTRRARDPGRGREERRPREGVTGTTVPGGRSPPGTVPGSSPQDHCKRAAPRDLLARAAPPCRTGGEGAAPEGYRGRGPPSTPVFTHRSQEVTCTRSPPSAAAVPGHPSLGPQAPRPPPNRAPPASGWQELPGALFPAGHPDGYWGLVLADLPR